MVYTLSPSQFPVACHSVNSLPYIWVIIGILHGNSNYTRFLLQRLMLELKLSKIWPHWSLYVCIIEKCIYVYSILIFNLRRNSGVDHNVISFFCRVKRILRLHAHQRKTCHTGKLYMHEHYNSWSSLATVFFSTFCKYLFHIMYVEL